MQDKAQTKRMSYFHTTGMHVEESAAKSDKHGWEWNAMTTNFRLRYLC